MADDINELAEQIITYSGGKDNIAHFTHCATRLRLQLVSNDSVDDSAIKSLKQVLGTVFAGGQYQIIIGNKVSVVYKAIQTQMQKNDLKDISQPSEAESKTSKKETLVSNIFGIISGSFLPLLGLLAGAGMLKALLMLSDKFGLLSQDSDTFILLSSIANAPFYFLPILLGFSLAKRLDANPFMGAAIGAALLEPGFMALIGSQELYFLGIQVIPLDYSASVFPVFIAVLFYAWFEKLLKRFIPESIQLFLVPMLSLIIVIPLTMLVFGPFGTFVGQQMANIALQLSGTNGLLAGIVLGGFYTFIVLFGLHWGLVPIVLANLGSGGDPIYAMGGMSAFAQMGVALGFLLKSRDKQLRTLAAGSLFPAIFSGVTEPIIYGLLVPYRKTFIYIVIAGAIGGGINGFFHVEMVSYAFASFLGIPAYSPMIIYLSSAIVTVIVAALLVVLFGYQSKESKKAE